MTTHDKDKIIAAAKECVEGTYDSSRSIRLVGEELVRFYAIARASRDAEVVSLTNQRDYEYVRAENAEHERDTAWAQAHRLALELECLIMDTKDNAVVSKWWDSAFEAIEEYQTLKPGADEESEAWAKMRKVGI